MISIVANFSEKFPVLFFFLLLSVSTTNLSCLLATTFSSLRFFFNFTSLQCFESGQRGFLFSHFRVLSSILSLSFCFVYKDDIFFVVCWMGTTHSTKIVQRPRHGAMAVRSEVFTTENSNPPRCPISLVTYNS